MAPRLSISELLARLVAFDTTSRNSNLPLVDFICEYLERPGVRFTRQAATEEPKANLVVEMGPETDADARDGLILSGHTDVVPAEEPVWRSDPFELCERKDRFYGRGTADMKGFLALAIDAASRIDPAKLRVPLVLLFTYDEEVGTLGARHFRHHWPDDHPLPRHAVIGEPTELAVVRSHKGHLKCRWEILGAPAHSAYPHLGRNAIEPAGALVQGLVALREIFESERLPSSSHFPEVPWASLNIARIEGGTAINIVPERCTVEAGLRLLPGMDPEVAERRLREVGEEALAGIDRAFLVLSVSPPMETSPDAFLLRELLNLTGQDDSDRAVMFASDAGWFQEMGIECVIWGPGSITVAHKANESIERSQLEGGRRLLNELLHRTVLEPSSETS